jgi:hypothetical protein
VVTFTGVQFTTVSLQILSETSPQKSSVDVLPNEIALVDDPMESHCYSHHCPQGRINKIIIKDIGEQGLNDRFYIFDTISNIAGYMCATLYVPSPHKVLTQYHNQNFPPVDPSMPWGEYFEFYFLDDNSPAVIEYSEFDEGGANVTNDTILIRSNDRSDFEEMEQLVQEQQQRNSTASPGNEIVIVIDAYGNMYRWLARVSTLLEERKHGLNSSDPLKRALPLQPEGCTYTQFRPSATIGRITDAVMARIQADAPTNAIFGTLHVRRTDTVAECNTSLEVMQDYLDCSLRNTSDHQLAFLLSSDEPDNAYRQALIDMPKKMGWDHVRLLDLDNVVLDTMHTLINSKAVNPWINNNFVRFTVINNIQAQLWLRLIKRRHLFCNKCDSVTQQIQAREWNSSYWS